MLGIWSSTWPEKSQHMEHSWISFKWNWRLNSTPLTWQFWISFIKWQLSKLLFLLFFYNTFLFEANKSSFCQVSRTSKGHWEVSIDLFCSQIVCFCTIEYNSASSNSLCSYATLVHDELLRAKTGFIWPSAELQEKKHNIFKWSIFYISHKKCK